MGGLVLFGSLTVIAWVWLIMRLRVVLTGDTAKVPAIAKLEFPGAQGTTCLLRVRLPEGTTATVPFPQLKSFKKIDVGDEVRVSWRPRSDEHPPDLVWGRPARILVAPVIFTGVATTTFVFGFIQDGFQ